MMPTKEILIVDDEVGIRELLSEILQDEGYRVASPRTRREARAYRARQQPALVLLDIWMPDTDGVTLLREWAASRAAHDAGRDDVRATARSRPRSRRPRSARSTSSRSRSACRSCSARSRARSRSRSAQEPRRVSLAALGTSAAVREAERALEQLLAARKPMLILGEPGTGHDVAARALHAAGRAVGRARRRARGSRRIRSRCSRRRATARSIAPRSASTRRPSRRGSRSCCRSSTSANVTLVCTSAEPLGNLAAEGKFDAGAARGAVGRRRAAAAAARAARGHSRADRALLARRRDAEGTPSAAARALARCQPAALTALAERVLAGQPRPSAERRREPRAHRRRGEITPDHVKRLLGEAAAANPGGRARRSPRASSSCRCARRARRSSASTSSSCWAASRAT